MLVARSSGLIGPIACKKWQKSKTNQARSERSKGHKFVLQNYAIGVNSELLMHNTFAHFTDLVFKAL